MNQNAKDCTTCEYEDQPFAGEICASCQEAVTDHGGGVLTLYHHYEPKQDQPICNTPGRYMVSITGRGAPTKEHDTLEMARSEAMRLLIGGDYKEARILQVVDVARISVVWESEQ